MRSMRMDGALGDKECCNREPVCIVKWRESKSIEDEFLPCDLSVKSQK